MHDKEEVLQHLDEIKSALIDKDNFFPYNYNALIIWGVIGMLMSVIMPPLISKSITWGVLFSVVIMGIGFAIESFMTKQVNEDYDIDNCTKKQKFIATTFILLTFFAIVLSALMAKYQLITPIFTVWVFLIGFGYFSLGYVLNINSFSFLGYLAMGSALLLLTISLFMQDLGSLHNVLFFFSQGVSFVLLGVIPVLIARKLKREI